MINHTILKTNKYSMVPVMYELTAQSGQEGKGCCILLMISGTNVHLIAASLLWCQYLSKCNPLNAFFTHYYVEYDNSYFIS